MFLAVESTRCSKARQTMVSRFESVPKQLLTACSHDCINHSRSASPALCPRRAGEREANALQTSVTNTTQRIQCACSPKGRIVGSWRPCKTDSGPAPAAIGNTLQMRHLPNEWNGSLAPQTSVAPEAYSMTDGSPALRPICLMPTSTTA